MKWLMTGAVCTLFAVSGCGITYINPTVRSTAKDLEVREVKLTPQSVAIANREPYTPRSLPAAFFQTAGGSRQAAAAAGNLPSPPFVPEEVRETLELRVPPAANPGPYEIGVGDVLLLATSAQTSSTEEQLTGLLAAQNQRQGYTVRDDGTISIPQVGVVPLLGLTVEEAEARLFETIVNSGLSPDFSLEVAEFNSQQVSIGGAVGNTTLVPVGLRPVSLTTALAAAGGVQAPDAEFASIRIYRDGTLYQIPFEDYLSRPSLQSTRLINGDMVYVDTSYDLDRALRFYEQRLNVIQLRNSARAEAVAQLNAEIAIRQSALSDQRGLFQARESLGAEKRDYVYVAGEAASQRRFVMPYNQQVTLADVLYDGGGFNTATGNAREIYVLRASANPAEFGAVTAWHLNATNAVTLSLATKFEMRPDDIVFIEAQPITVWNRALSQAIPLFGQATALAAGAAN